MNLSLDLSTSHMGYAVYDKLVFIEAGCLDLSPKDSIHKRLDQAIEFLDVLCKKYNIKEIYIEQYAKAYSLSSISTILILSSFIETLMYCMYLKNIKCEMINVLSARKRAGLVIPKQTDRKNTKSVILNFIQNRISKQQCPILYEVKKTGTPKDHCFDVADAIVIALAVNFSENQ